MNMNSFKEIGGYFGLETAVDKFKIDNKIIALNTARNCLRYIIRAFEIHEINMPYYTCPVVWQAAQKEKCRINFYHIDENFMPVKEFKENDFVLYNNYFGVCARNVKILEKKYKNLIVDNAQAFYMPKCGIASFNSLRKFFGVSDGAFLISDKILNENFETDTSYQRFSHLLKRTDINANFGYTDFCMNEESLNDEPVKFISELTKTIISSIDIEAAKHIRLENFNILSKSLNHKNELNLNPDNDDVPMVYPFLVHDKELKQYLIKNKIYTATYWNPLPKDYQEGIFQKYIIPLPVDQRYTKGDMQRILEVINGKN